MYICICHGVTERQVVRAVTDGAQTLDDLQIDLGVGSCCGRCVETASEYLPGGQTQVAISAAGASRGTAVEEAANDAVVGNMAVQSITRLNFA